MKKYKFKIFADYYQFYLQDEEVKGDLSASWDEKANKNMLALAPGTIGIGTANRQTNVSVEIIVADQLPEMSFDDYDRINECSIEIESGKLVVAGSTEFFPDARRIELIPGIYKARVCYKNLNKQGGEGKDEYLIILGSMKKLNR